MEPNEVTVFLVDTFKGGVGKSTTASWLARSFSDLQHRTLLVGLSPQNDLIPLVASRYVGLRDVIGTDAFPSVIELSPTLFYVPAGQAALPAEDPGLADLVRRIAAKRDCEFCVVDGTQFLQDSSWWMLDGADVFVVPATPYAEAVGAALRTLIAVPHYQRNFQKAMRVQEMVLLLTAVPSASKLPKSSAELLEHLRASERFAPFILENEVRWSSQRRPGQNALVPLDGEPIKTHLVNNRLAEDYLAVAKEILARLSEEDENEGGSAEESPIETLVETAQSDEPGGSGEVVTHQQESSQEKDGEVEDREVFFTFDVTDSMTDEQNGDW